MQGLTTNFLSEFHQREYIAMRAVGDTDVFLQTDAGIKAALKNMPESRIISAVEMCRPWRSYAMIGLCNSL